jgi:RNA polymerase sigma factor (sigma-70 family)
MSSAGRKARLPARLASDERLVRLASVGDRRAFAEIYERYHQKLYRYCRSILRNDEDARDALQNTMLKALGALPGEERTIELKPWLYRIAHNESMSVVRKRTSAEELDEASMPTTAGADRVAADRERLRGLVTDLAELTERQRGALVMRELGGLEFGEIATTFGMSPGAARQTVHQARLSLQHLVEGRDMACDSARETISAADGRLLAARKVRAHLSSCDSCRDFRTAIGLRTKDLQALTPSLATPPAAKILASLLGAGRDGGSGGTIGSLLGGGGGKLAGGSLAVKAAAVGAATLTIGAAVVAIEKPVGRDPGSSSPPAQAPDRASAADHQGTTNGSHGGGSATSENERGGSDGSSGDGTGGQKPGGQGAHPGASTPAEQPPPAGPPTGVGPAVTPGPPGGSPSSDAGLGTADQVVPGGLPAQTGEAADHGPPAAPPLPASPPVPPGAGSPAGPPAPPGGP